jgi:hypothetical protein
MVKYSLYSILPIGGTRHQKSAPFVYPLPSEMFNEQITYKSSPF